MTRPPSELPSHGEFLSAVGDDFDTLDGAGEAFSLQLTGCSALHRDAGYAAYTLTFQSTERFAREQGTLTLTHRQLGPAEIFLVPAGVGASGAEYVASFTILEA